MSEFTCQNCNRTFKKINNSEWNDEKANEEFINDHPDCINDDIGVICDDCHKEFKIWFLKLTCKQKENMRMDYENEKK